MRRDVGFYIEASIDRVYQAYLDAATHPPFERSCKEEPYHTISFGINFSFKYNMNGGSCNIHLMPCGSGTAVNMRFSVAQAAGARYERYAQDLNSAMQAFLPVAPQRADYDMDEFLKPANQVTPSMLTRQSAQTFRAAAPAPVPEPAPVPAPAPAPAPEAAPAPAPAPEAAPQSAAAFCTRCGNPLDAGDRFCSRCGAPCAAPARKVCPNCRAEAEDDDAFCCFCGTKLS